MDKEVITIDKLKNESNNTRDDLGNKTNNKTILSNIFTKKNIKIIILVLIGIFALILFMGLDDKEGDVEETSTNNYGYTTTLEYCKELEGKLERLLSNVSGAGNVNVMISVEGSPELVYATNDSNKSSSTSSGSTTTSSSNPIIVESGGVSNPLILTENLPEVKGVIVVSSGADDIAIKLNLLNAVSTLLNVSTEKISILKGI